MDAIFDILAGVFADGAALMLAVLVFLATAVLTFGVMAAVRVRGSVKRRTASIDALARGSAVEDQGSLRRSSLKAAQRVLDYTAKHYGSSDQGAAKVLRQRMIRAGIYDARAVGYFFVGRLGLAIGLALAAEARASALILSSLPIAIFAVIQFVTPEFYASVWDEDITKKALAVAGFWMGVGNFIMYRLVNFRI